MKVIRQHSEFVHNCRATRGPLMVAPVLATPTVTDPFCGVVLDVSMVEMTYVADPVVIEFSCDLVAAIAR